MNQKELLNVVSSLSRSPSTQGPLVCYILLLDFGLKIEGAKLAKLTNQSRTTVYRSLRTLEDLGLIADCRALDPPTEASLGRLAALREGLLAVDPKSGEVFGLGTEKRPDAFDSGPDACPVFGQPVRKEDTPRPNTGHPVFQESTENPEAPSANCPVFGQIEGQRNEANLQLDSGLGVVEPSAPPESAISTYGDKQLITAIELDLGTTKQVTTAVSHAERRLAKLQNMVNPKAVEVLDAWRKEIGMPAVKWDTPRADKLESYLKSKSYRAVVKALGMGYSVAQLKRVAVAAGKRTPWEVERFMNQPYSMLKDAETIDIHLAAPKKGKADPKDRRGLGLGINDGTGEDYIVF